MAFWMCNPVDLPSTHFSSNPRDWPSQAYVRSHFGQRVLWHESSYGGGRHLTAEALEPYRLLGDATFDDILDLYAKESRPLRPGDDWLERAASATHKSHHDNDGNPNESLSEADRASKDALAYYSKLPTWVDKAQLKRGQD
eukprot:scaffold2388_cov163-Amphora_coffeaeformis.AAC.1